ncbi:hypothetical protein J4450_04885 [Candidatus Micrarchaeota archaeon]|nr:hypothetical protein [Candidatus Micrarchaeota archaeon]
MGRMRKRMQRGSVIYCECGTWNNMQCPDGFSCEDLIPPQAGYATGICKRIEPLDIKTPEELEKEVEDALKVEGKLEIKPDITEAKFTMLNKTLLFTGGYADASVIQINGRYLMYLNKFGQASATGVFVLSSQDGLSWKEETDVILDGVAVARAVRFSNGVRVYYHQPPMKNEDKGAIVSSFSSDGLSSWQYEGVRIRPRSGYDAAGPTVIQLDNGTYRMFFYEIKEGTDAPPNVPAAEIYGASSKDGLTWNRDAKATIVSEMNVEGDAIPTVRHPMALKWKDGYLMFYWTHQKIYAAYSQDGFSWKKLGYTGIKGADPDAIPLSEGNIRLYFGGECIPSEQDCSKVLPGPGNVHTTILKIEWSAEQKKKERPPGLLFEDGKYILVLNDIALDQTVPAGACALIEIVKIESEASLQKGKICKGSDYSWVSPEGKQFKIRLLDIAPGYSGGAKWANFLIFG